MYHLSSRTDRYSTADDCSSEERASMKATDSTVFSMTKSNHQISSCHDVKVVMIVAQGGRRSGVASRLNQCRRLDMKSIVGLLPPSWIGESVCSFDERVVFFNHLCKSIFIDLHERR